jgi:hypothetical protein
MVKKWLISEIGLSRGAFAMRNARILLAAAALCSAATCAIASDRVEADRFGNLVLHSASGYKAIVVGAGHMADRFRTGSLEDPRVVYLRDNRPEVTRRTARCPGVLLHGRSYMYGLPDNVVPVLAAECN